jgi:uncharacterized protein (TIGR04255 family)
LWEFVLSQVPKPPYRKAPITEAVIHLRVAGNATADEQQKVHRRLTKIYPHTQELSEFSVTFDTTGGAATVQQANRGFRLTSEDQADVLLIFPNGLAVARLAPYGAWEQLREKAVAAWGEWRRDTKYRPVDRLGIRYINRIDIPLMREPLLKFDKYLKFHPLVPNLGGGALSGYMIQATTPTSNPLWMTSITSSIVVPPPIIDHLSLLLDIDVFRTREIPGKDDELWHTIDEARAIKNRIFESCITDESRKLFA